MSLSIGQTLCDMHDGLQLPEGVEVVGSSVIRDIEGGHLVIDMLLSCNDQFEGKYQPRYTNKMLTVVGYDWGHQIWTAMYSYDGHTLGIFILKEKS